jgi:hypothetical protein
MTTYNKIADEIAGALSRPFDAMFKQRVKTVFKHELARMLRQSMDKHGLDRQLVQRYTAELQEVDEADTSVKHDCIALRTVDKIYKPIRWNTVEAFTFVGMGNIPFVYRHGVESVRFSPFLFLTGKSTSYDYRNEYIYVYGGKRFKNVTIESVFEDMAEIVAIDTEEKLSKSRPTCTDDMVIPVPGDLVQLVKERLLSGELSIIDDKDKVKPTHIDNN